MKKICLKICSLGALIFCFTGPAFSIPAPPAPLPVAEETDVKLAGVEANAAYGYFAGNDDLTDVRLKLGDNSFVKLAKSDESGTAFDFFFNGFEFDISAPETPSGDFTLSWNGGVVPAYFDFVFAVKAADGYAYYLFDDVGIITTPSFLGGSFKVQMTNGNNKFQDLSHLSAYGRLGAPPPPGEIPEPATMLLFGTGLAGLASVVRRKKK